MTLQSQQQQLFSIYVLKLVKQKFYIGKTSKSVLYRFEQHKKGKGASWTKVYEPIDIIKQYKTNDLFEEDICTKRYMNLYGMDNVRGGSYANIQLHDWQLKALSHELKGSNDLCFRCGMSGHFASNCSRFYNFEPV